MRIPIALAAALVFALSAAAQSPFVVKDINATHASANSSNPHSFLELNGSLLFFAATEATGRELWRVTNGTPSLVRDISPGTRGSVDNNTTLMPIGNIALFHASDASGSTDLWRTDGTTAGTVKVKDVNPSGDDNVFVLASIGGKVFFFANDGVAGREPWVSDGTAAGTRLLVDVNAGSASTNGAAFVEAGDRIFIFTNNTLWVSNGTPEGTTHVPVTLTGTSSYRAVGSDVYFSSQSSAGRELWRTNGTIAGTFLVRDIRPGPGSGFEASPIFLLGSTPYFVATDDGVDWDLWKTDGTAAGTTIVKPSFQLFAGARFSPRLIASEGGLLFLQTDRELWRSDGTDAGTYPLFEGFVTSMTRAFGRTLFIRELNGRDEIWTTDGTPAGTTRFLSARVWSTRRLFPIGDKLYFSGFSNLNGGEPWVSDGTEAGTRMIANIAPDPAPSSSPANLMAADDLLFFRAAEDSFHFQLWRSDGTAAGTIELTDLGDEFNSPRIEMLTTWGGWLWFMYESRIWRSDGTVEGTAPFPGVFGSMLQPTRDLLYFERQQTLWRTDGTEAGTGPVSTAAHPADRPSGIVAELAGRTYVLGGSIGPGPGLFITDGTTAGTRRLFDIPFETELRNFMAGAGALWFTRRTNDAGVELWRSDATFGGTKLVKDIAPGSASSNPAALTAAGPYLYFVADDGTHGRELWRSDGTEAGTILLRDITTGSASSNLGKFTPAGTILYFTVRESGRSELWRTDGTPDGTKRVTDLNLTASQVPLETLVVADGVLYFAAGDGVHGMELWRTTGVDSVAMVADLEPGSGSSSPTELTQAGRLLYFAAGGPLGRELWALPLASSAISIDDVRVGEGGTARLVVTRSGNTSSSASAAFTTISGTAASGSDFVATSGTVTFAPGQTSATIEVAVSGDAAAENDETFFVALANPSGTAITRAVAAAIIADDDRVAALSIEWLPPSFLHNVNTDRVLRVRNEGPSDATDVRFFYSESPGKLTFAINPAMGGVGCIDPQPCRLNPIAAGAFVDVVVRVNTRHGTYTDPQNPPGRTIHARVTAAESDPDSSNNALSRMITSDGRLVLPEFLTSGSTATGLVVLDSPAFSTGASVTLQSSGANLVPSPATVVIPNQQQTGTFTLTAGGATGFTKLTATVFGRASSLMVPVVAPGQSPKLDVAIYTEDVSVVVGQPARLYVEVAARRADGLRPTGNVALLDANGNVVAQQQLVDGATTFVRSGLTSGAVYKVRYDGDAVFNALSGAQVIAFVSNWETTTALQIQPVVCGSVAVTVSVRSTVTTNAPTGSIVLTAGNTITIATLPLQPTGRPGESLASGTITVPAGQSYLSARYEPAGTFSMSSDDKTVDNTACSVTGMTVTAISRDSVQITWTPNGAHHYDVVSMVNRSSYGIEGSTTGNSFTDTNLSPDRVVIYFVCAMSATNQRLGCSQPDLALTGAFHDGSLSSVRTALLHGSDITRLQDALFTTRSFTTATPPAFTPVGERSRAVLATQIEELRAAINTLRHALGMEPYPFEGTLAPDERIGPKHVQELRHALR